MAAAAAEPECYFYQGISAVANLYDITLTDPPPSAKGNTPNQREKNMTRMIETWQSGWIAAGKYASLCRTERWPAWTPSAIVFCPPKSLPTLTPENFDSLSKDKVDKWYELVQTTQNLACRHVNTGRCFQWYDIDDAATRKITSFDPHWKVGTPLLIFDERRGNKDQNMQRKAERKQLKEDLENKFNISLESSVNEAVEALQKKTKRKLQIIEVAEFSANQFFLNLTESKDTYLASHIQFWLLLVLHSRTWDDHMNEYKTKTLPIQNPHMIMLNLILGVANRFWPKKLAEDYLSRYVSGACLDWKLFDHLSLLIERQNAA